MHEAAGVRVRQPIRDLGRELERFLDRQRTRPLDPCVQRFAFHVRHHAERQTVGLARIEDTENVGVLEAGRDADLARETFDADACGELRIQHLHRDARVVAQVPRKVDHGHAATADLTFDRVPFGDDAAQPA
jgi:hypothetical protein